MVFYQLCTAMAMYGSECWPTTKDAEKRLSVMETKMLRRLAGVSLLDHVRNDDLRQKYGVSPIMDKLREIRMRWHGHVLRAKDNTLAKLAMNQQVQGDRRKGRPKQRWLDTLHIDMKNAGVHPDMSGDRGKWRQRIKVADFFIIRDKCFLKKSSTKTN